MFYLAIPLNLEFYTGLPEEIPNSRLAKNYMANPIPGAFKAPIPLMLAVANPRSRIRKALWGDLPTDRKRIYPRKVEVPSGGGIGTARAMAKAYGTFANGGEELGLRMETLKQLMAPACPPTRGFYDEVMKLDGMQLSLGFMKPSPQVPYGHPSSFGMLGFGGYFGFADPHSKIGFAYILNRNDVYLSDPRQNALRLAMYRSIGETDPFLSHDKGEVHV